MKTLLVATDFSIPARKAAWYAADMAMAIRAKIVLLHVYQIPVTYLEVPVVINELSIQQEVEINILKLKEELNERTNGAVDIKTEIKTGSFFNELKNVCQLHAPYAVILGSQGTSAYEHILYGTHAVYTTRHLDWPVITVPNGARFSAIKNICLACDFSNIADATVADEIKQFAEDFNAELHVLNTAKKTDFHPLNTLESGLLQERIGNLNPHYHFIINEKTDESIIEFAEKNNIDLLIVLPKRHGLIDKLIHKSVTRQLVLYSHVPVMSLHHHTDLL